jgi:hypothetical protein
MIVYSKGNSYSLDFKANVNAFAPIIRVDKNVNVISDLITSGFATEDGPSVTLDEELRFVRSKVRQGDNSPHYAIFENTFEAEILESAPGFTNGGIICITEHYVGIGYLEGSKSFEVFRQADVKMIPTFMQISPLSYISTEYGSLVGAPPTSYLPVLDGAYATYSSAVCPNIPDCSSAFISNGKVVGLYGLNVNSFSPNYFPTSRTGIAKALVRGRLYGPEAKVLGEEEGITISPAIRSSVQKFINAVRAGSRVSNPTWSRKQIRPASLSRYISSDFSLLMMADADLFDAATEVAFPPTKTAIPGPGLREYVNDPTLDNALFVIGPNRVQVWLEEYRQNVEKFKKQGYKALIKSVITLFDSFTNKVATFNPTIEIELNDTSGKFFAPGVYRKLVSNIPSPFRKIKLTIPANYVALSADQCREEILKQIQAISPIAEVISFNEQTITMGDGNVTTKTPYFDEDKYENVISKYLAGLQEKAAGFLEQIVSAFGSLSAGISNYDYVFTQSGSCGSSSSTTVKAYPESISSSLANIMAFNSDKSKNLITDFRVENFRIKEASEGANTLEFRVAMDIEIPLVSKCGICTPFDSVASQCASSIKAALFRTGLPVDIAFKGYGKMNPYGFKVGKASTSIYGNKYVTSQAILGDAGYNTQGQSSGSEIEVAVPSFRFTVYFNTVILANPSNQADQFEFLTNMYESVSKVEEKAVYLAMRILAGRLQADGLITSCYFCGDYGGTYVTLQDMCKLASYKNSETLAFLLDILYNMMAAKDEFAALTDKERACVTLNIQNITEALRYANYIVGYDNGHVTLTPMSTPDYVTPWIMDDAHFNTIAGDVDYDLIPTYGVFA